MDWYDEKDLKNPDNREVMVAFDPNVNARGDSNIWRSYIWLKWEKNMIFFVADNLSQKEMEAIIRNYWVIWSDIIMLDWWPSSQFATKLEDKNYYWKWGVPQFNLIYRYNK